MVQIVLPLLLLAAATPAAQKATLDAPPGTVYLKGGKTQIGNKVKTIENLLETAPSMQKFASGFISETPLVKKDVAPYFLMVNEVTGEQYAAFVEATSYQPPHLWGEEAITVARSAYLEEQGLLRKEAKDRGEKPASMTPFDDQEWWQKNWEECEWGLPTKITQMPVTFVNYQDARAYARWAGLRLMSEEEYQYAARKGTERSYPWGEDWEDGRCASMEINRAEVMKIASYPKGATEDGIFDLSGNVWEWTTSRFSPYDGYKRQTFKFGRGRSTVEVAAMAKWDLNKRVAVGGSILTSRQICRVTTRRGTERFEKTSAMGFRCASSPSAGLDRSIVILNDIPNEHRPSTTDGPVEYSPELVVAMDRWTTTASDSQREGIALPNSAELTAELPPQYAIISGYSFIGFIPVTGLKTSTLTDLRKASLEGDLVHLGVLATDQEIIDPPIGKGTWMIAFRGGGQAPKSTTDKSADEEEVLDVASLTQREQAELALEFDTSVDTLIFFNSLGKPVASIAADRLSWENPKKPTVAPVDRVFTMLDEEEEEIEYTERWLEFEPFVSGKGRKGARFVLGLRFADGVVDGDWRKN